MPEEVTVSGIVLRRRDAGEADRRLTLLTAEIGRVDVVAKGARKPTSRFAGVSEPLCQGRFTFAEGRVNKFLTQAEPTAGFLGLRADYDRLTCALALAELYSGVVPEGDEVGTEALPILLESLQALDQHPEPGIALVWAETLLLEWSGFQPSWTVEVDEGGPLTQTQRWVSPQAGGLLSDAGAHHYQDRIRCDWMDAMALSKLPFLAEAPPKCPGWMGCLLALYPFWKNVVDTALPANESLLQDIRQRQMGSR